MLKGLKAAFPASCSFKVFLTCLAGKTAKMPKHWSVGFPCLTGTIQATVGPHEGGQQHNDIKQTAVSRYEKHDRAPLGCTKEHPPCIGHHWTILDLLATTREKMSSKRKGLIFPELFGIQSTSLKWFDPPDSAHVQTLDLWEIPSPSTFVMPFSQHYRPIHRVFDYYGVCTVCVGICSYMRILYTGCTYYNTYVQYILRCL